MYISKFIIATPSDIDANQYLLYNTYSTAFVSLEKSIYQEVFVQKDFSNEEIVPTLKTMGFLLDEEGEELKKLETKRKKYMDEKTQSVTIVTTTDCNARCEYCFEKGIERYSMTKDTADQVIEFIKKTFLDKKLIISWFGGEPLLNFEIIEYITLKLIDEGYTLDSHTTTNGALITAEKIAFLKKHYQEVSFQVSIDELDEEYFAVKKYIDLDKHTAFDQVIKNVGLLMDADIASSVRINFIPSKIERAIVVYKKIKELLSAYKMENIYIYFAPLNLHDKNEIISRFKGDMEHPWMQAVKVQYEERFPVNKLKYATDNKLLAAFCLTPYSYSCGMTTENRFSIDADGTIYKCHRFLGKPQYNCGNIYSGINKEAEFYKIFRNHVISEKECNNCSILPMCHGGCIAQRIMYGEDHRCNRIKQIKGKLLNAYHKELLKENDSTPSNK